MTYYYILDVKTLQSLSLHFVPTLQSAVYILYTVCSLLSAFCTNRYPWQQYSLFLVTFIRKTHIIYHKIPVSPFVRMQTPLTMFQVIHPPYKKVTLACIACLCFEIGVCPWPDLRALFQYTSLTPVVSLHLIPRIQYHPGIPVTLLTGSSITQSRSRLSHLLKRESFMFSLSQCCLGFLIFTMIDSKFHFSPTFTSSLFF